jgi:hypothetical protein
MVVKDKQGFFLYVTNKGMASDDCELAQRAEDLLRGFAFGTAPQTRDRSGANDAQITAQRVSQARSKACKKKARRREQEAHMRFVFDMLDVEGNGILSAENLVIGFDRINTEQSIDITTAQQMLRIAGCSNEPMTLGRFMDLCKRHRLCDDKRSGKQPDSACKVTESQVNKKELNPFAN